MNVSEWAAAAETLARVGGWGIALVFIFGMLAGRIVPRFVIRDVRADRDARLLYQDERVGELKKEAASWKAAHAASEETRGQQAALLREAIQGIENLTRLVSGPAAPPITTNGSGPYVP